MNTADTLAEARRAHDTELRALTDETAMRVLAGRDRAERQIRLTLARTYGRAGMASHSQWQILPCLTGDGTLGILDIVRGTAWDTGVVADPGVHDLGLEEQVYGAANGIAGGDIKFDGVLVQRDGATPGAALAMPPAWRQIALPSWRQGDVRTTDYQPATWIRPRLVAAGLMTCYGTPGERSAAATLHATHGWDAQWPWGVPDWVEGTSVTVVDLMIERSGPGRRDRTRRPRGTEAEEMALVQDLISRVRRLVPGALRQVAEALEARPVRGGPPRGTGGQLRDLADRAERGDETALDDAEPVLSAVGNATNWSEAGVLNMVTAVRRARQADCAWDAAWELGLCGQVAVLLDEIHGR